PSRCAILAGMDDAIRRVADTGHNRPNQYGWSRSSRNRIAGQSYAIDCGWLVKNNLFGRIIRCVIKIREQVALLIKRRYQVGSKAIIERQFASGLPAILREEFEVPVRGIFYQCLAEL